MTRGKRRVTTAINNNKRQRMTVTGTPKDNELQHMSLVELNPELQCPFQKCKIYDLKMNNEFKIPTSCESSTKPSNVILIKLQ